MSETNSFGGWLRKNAEKHLMQAAADDMAGNYRECTSKSYREKGFGPFFWRKIFVPVYLMVPWKIRKKIILMSSYSGVDRPKWKKFD
ncbi:MAG: hypothetical protein ACR2NC_01825 [Thermodesulfobacteriota bacterium]